MRRILSLLTAVCLLLGLTACGDGKKSDGLEIYYAVRDGGGYDQAGVQSEIWTDVPDTVTIDDLFPRLLTAPEDGERYVVFPSTVRLLGWTLEEGLLTVDLSESYSELSGISLTLADYCLVLTAAQLDGVERVCITVEGQPLPEGGEGFFAASDVLLSGEGTDTATYGESGGED